MKCFSLHLPLWFKHGYHPTWVGWAALDEAYCGFQNQILIKMIYLKAFNTLISTIWKLSVSVGRNCDSKDNVSVWSEESGAKMRREENDKIKVSVPDFEIVGPPIPKSA